MKKHEQNVFISFSDELNAISKTSMFLQTKHKQHLKKITALELPVDHSSKRHNSKRGAYSDKQITCFEVLHKEFKDSL